MENKTEIVNSIIHITMEMDEVYKYHPDNPECRDVVEYYDMLKRQRDELVELERQSN
jgi:hypothetical protein